MINIQKVLKPANLTINTNNKTDVGNNCATIHESLLFKKNTSLNKMNYNNLTKK